MKRRLLMALTGLFLLLVGHASGRVAPVVFTRIKPDDPVNAAVNAFIEGRESAAAELAKPLAAQGDGNAFFLLGVILDLGLEPARMSKAQAMDLYYGKAEKTGNQDAKWRRMLIPLAAADAGTRDAARAALESAAEKDGRASRLLGEAWLRGLVDGNINVDNAESCWQTAFRLKDEGASVLLAELYVGAYGFPAKTDRDKSIGYFRIAAGKGDKRAFVPLAKLLLSKDDPILRNEARDWLARALKEGDWSAYLVLGDNAHVDEKSGKEAYEIYQKGAEKGQSECMLRLATLFLNQAEKQSDGMTWLRKSADAGNAEASAQMGRRLAKTETATAYRYLLMAANEGVSSAQYELAMIYLDGALGYQDSRSAVAWLTQAMKSGDAEIQYQLARMHESGTGCPINYANAGVLYTLASNKGHLLAPGRIAWMTNEGLGTKRNPVQAWAYASLGAERGDSSVGEMLTSLGKEMSPGMKMEAEQALIKARAPGSLPEKNGERK